MVKTAIHQERYVQCGALILAIQADATFISANRKIFCRALFAALELMLELRLGLLL